MPRHGELRRSWPQRLLIAFNVACIATALVGASSLAYAKQKVGQIDRVPIGSAGFVTDDVAPTEPRNFLLVGADTTDGLPEDAVERGGRSDVEGVRSDTIMIVRVDPGRAGAQILSIPRDLWVSIPGKSSKTKINAALRFGGPSLLIDTIGQTFDIEINNYVQVDFAGFKSLVGELGGVPMYFDRSVRDRNIGLEVTGPACVTLDSQQALNYVRSRFFQYQLPNGKWRGDPTSDLGRASRQQDFIRRVISRAKQQGLRNPVKLKSYLDLAVDNVTLDGQTTPGELLSLGKAFRNFDAEELKTYTLPVTDNARTGALDLISREAAPLLALFRDPVDQPAEGDVAPDSVSVRVLNGSNTPNQASTTSKALAAIGFPITSIDGAAPVEQTEVRFPPGQDAAAVAVARHLQADPVLVPDDAVEVVTVVTGPDFESVLTDARPASKFTTTTAPAPTAPPDEEPSSTLAETTTTTVPVPTTTVTGFVPGDPPPGVSCN